MNVSLQMYSELLLRYLRPQRRSAMLLGLLLFTSIGLELLNPQILRYFIDQALAGSPMRTLLWAGGFFLAIAIALQAVSVAETYLAESVGWTATNRLRSDLALHCLRLDLSFHGAHTPGELVERIDGDVAKLANFFSRFVIHVLGNALLFLGVLVLLYRIDIRVGVALTLFAMLVVVLLDRLRNLAVPYWAEYRQVTAQLFGFLEERLAGTEDIRANGGTAYTMRASYAFSRDLVRKGQKAAVLGSATGASSTLLFATGSAVALGLGAYLYRAGDITVGTVYLIFMYTELLRRPLEQITRQMQDLQQASASIVRIQNLFQEQPTVHDGPGTPLPAGALSVEFEDVYFGYEDDPTLHDLSFRLEPGTVLGLLGRTGSGKTTLTRLLFRLYDPQAGAVRLGGVDLREARVAEVRARVAMVTQEIQLFDASVRDNLTLFDRSVPDERILQSLHELGLREWYEGLPNGLDTRLASGGGGLSAGEAQLLAFVRVFLKDPDVVVLDEASSRLDPSTERTIERAIAKLLSGRTGIIIAHRLGTVERVDTIMILESGRLVEMGNREDLCSNSQSRFYQMLQVGLEEVLV